MSDGSTKIKNALNLEPQSADPSNPAEGDIFCSDGTSRAAGYWQYINGAWSEFGGGGQGGINYLAGDNSDAENGIGDWVTYADAAGENAVDGTGGTALGVTLTQNTTDPLREDADFKFSKDAADRQGEGASCAFTIDNADKAQKLTISFDYDASDANYADDDIRIAIYDVTNATLIRVNGEDLKGGKGTHLAQFQTAADSTSYRLIIHQSSTNATAYDVYLDNISVGPREVVKGAAMTDWKSYTPTFTGFGTVSDVDFQYKRVGDSMFIQGVFTSGTATAVEAQISLPNSLTVKSGTPLKKAGVYFRGSTSSADFATVLITGDDSFLNLGAVNAADDRLVAADGTATIGTSQKLSLNAQIPIQGWSSNAVTSEDLGGREVVARYTTNTEGTYANGVYTTIPYEDLDYDSTSSYNTSTGEYTVPETGYYDINAKAMLKSLIANAGEMSIAIYVDGAKVEDGFNYIENAALEMRNISSTVFLNKGQVVTIRLYQTNGGNRALFTQGTYNTFSIAKRSSPQTILETETVAARYTSDSGQASGTADVIVKYEDLVSDTHNAYDTSTGLYTIPVSGFYVISCSIQTANATWAFGNIVSLDIEVDGSEINEGVLRILGTDNTNFRLNNSTVVYLNKGQTVGIVSNNSQSAAISTNSNSNTFSISRIK